MLSKTRVTKLKTNGLNGFWKNNNRLRLLLITRVWAKHFEDDVCFNHRSSIFNMSMALIKYTTDYNPVLYRKYK